MMPLAWVLIQHDWCSHKRREIWTKTNRGECHDTDAEGRWSWKDGDGDWSYAAAAKECLMLPEAGRSKACTLP